MCLARLVPLLLLPLLVACSDQRATFEIKGGAHSLSLIRVTGMPWASQAKYTIVASRMPDCQRRHKLEPAAISPNFKVEVFMTGPNSFLLEQGRNLYAVETQTCQKFAKLDEAPKEGKGELVGVFREEGGKLVFVAAQPVKPEAK